MVRGGQPTIFNPMHWLKSKGLPNTRSLYFVAVCIIPLLLLPLTQDKYFIGLYVVGYILGAVKGWGAYFDMGVGTENRAQIAWIDRLLEKWFGTITAANSYWERIVRDYVGFYLRLNYFIGVFLLPLLYCAWMGQISILSAVGASAVLTTIFAAITPLFYGFYFSPKLPQASFNMAEFFTGALLMAETVVMLSLI